MRTPPVHLACRCAIGLANLRQSRHPPFRAVRLLTPLKMSYEQAKNEPKTLHGDRWCVRGDAAGDGRPCS